MESLAKQYKKRFTGPGMRGNVPLQIVCCLSGLLSWQVILTSPGMPFIIHHKIEIHPHEVCPIK